MTEQDERLQRAWLALAGDHEGMVWICANGARWTTGSEPASTHAIVSNSMLPDLHSPANWGHWQQVLAERFGECSLALDETDDGMAASCWLVTGIAHGRPAEAMMGALCLHADGQQEEGCVLPLPPEVLAWWKAEQGVSDE